MQELQILMNEIREWSDSAFGDGQRSIPILHHLGKEITEVIEAIRKNEGEPADAVLREYADCFMLLCDAVNHSGFSAERLLKATREKLEINKTRKWGEPDELGIIEHIEPEMKWQNCSTCGKPFKGNIDLPICPSCYV